MTDRWSLASKIAQKLERGGEIRLALEEKRDLFGALEEMRSGSREFPSRLSQLCADLDDDIAGYEV